MNFEKVNEIKSRFVSRKVGDELVLVPLVDNVAKMDKLFNLNETAGFLWEKLNEIDPDYAKEIHPNNYRYVIRAIEVKTIS